MTFLPRDISRCAGVKFGDDQKICKDRNSCLRYTTFGKTDRENGIENYANISVMSMMCNDDEFQSKIEVSK